MSESWLQTWLVGLNLAEYEDVLQSHGYTSPKNLASILERDQLKAMGVTKVGHLTRLFRAIQKLRSDGVGGEGSAEDGATSSLGNSLPPAPTVSTTTPVDSYGKNGKRVCFFVWDLI